MQTVLRSTLDTTIRDETEVFNHVSQTEMYRRIDRSYRKVFNLLIQAFGEAYFRADPPQSIPIVPGIRYYDLNADFFQAIEVRIDVLGTVYNVKKHAVSNSDLLLNSVGSTGRQLFYEIQGRQKTSALNSFKDQISLLPIPTAAGVLTVEYVPTSASFETGGDVTYADPQGWTSAYVVSDVSAFCMRKREQDERPYLTERDEVVAEIMSLRDARSTGPSRVRDVTSRRLPLDHVDGEDYE